MGVVPTVAPAGVPHGIVRSGPATTQTPQNQPVLSPVVAPVSKPPISQMTEPAEAPIPSGDGWRDRELVGEYYAFLGDQLKLRHQRNRSLEYTVEGFRRTEWSEAAERAFETGKAAPPTLDLSPAELHHLASIPGYKDRCSFYHSKLDRVMAAIQELLSGELSSTQPEVLTWK
jgi:hypothetical protein